MKGWNGKAIQAVSFHTISLALWSGCGLSKDKGKLYCWGYPM